MQHFCDVETRQVKEISPGARIRTFWGDKLLLSVVDLDPGAVVPTHYHPYEQAGTILAGALEMTIAGATRRLTPGDTYIIPAGVEHGAVSGDVPTRVLDVFSPVREDYQY